jgi:hypothetical protein
MVGKLNNSTYIAQRRFNDFTAWRSVPNKIKTSSQLSDVTREAIAEREEENQQSFDFDLRQAREFYTDVKSGLNEITSLFDGTRTQNNLDTMKEQLFTLQSSLNTFERALISAKSSIEPSCYEAAISRMREVQRMMRDALANSNNDLNRLTNAVFGQIERIEGLNGSAGRKIANNVVNGFLSTAQAQDTSKIDALIDAASDFRITGRFGGCILDAGPLISGPQILLTQALDNFNENTNDARTELKSVLTPILGTLNTVTRLLPTNITKELENITRQVTGISRTIDRGLSAVKSDGGQLQPLAGRYGSRTGARVSAQTFKIPKEFDPGFGGLATPPFVPTGGLGGINSVFPSIYTQSANIHPRFNTSSIGIISDKRTQVVPEISDIRLAILDSYRKMPGAALVSPEVANGPSLTTPVVEREVAGVIGNTRTGTTVADLVGTVQSAAQVLTPRIG